MIKKVLIVNRGEIAIRIMRACREMGIATVAVYSKADKDSLFVSFADEAVCIGPAPATESYLYIPAILCAAEQKDVDAIHPGYGFLAENARFSEICEKCNITFIGPDSSTIDLLGSKEKSRVKAAELNVPLSPGSKGILKNVEEAVTVATQIGYPVMLKASAGGGGRGIRVVRKESELGVALATIQQEAGAAFGSSDVFMEKFFEEPKHYEVQILGDGKGKAIHIGDRDCSVQRRNQKIIEEGNATSISDAARESARADALRLVETLNYKGAGTVEFLLDGDEYFFLEVNTRIQVEHCVSEEISGIDLIRKQIEIASGDVELVQDDVKFSGHALECRVNAEDPINFMPSAGKITKWIQPGGLGVRIDSGFAQGYTVLPHYDSLVAKVITKGDTRDIAINRMKSALREFVVEGIKTNIPLHLQVLEHPKFLDGSYTTKLLSEMLQK